MISTLILCVDSFNKEMSSGVSKGHCHFVPCLVPSINVLCVFVFNVPPTAKVIWRRGHSLKSHPTDCYPWFTRQVVYPLHHGSSFLHLVGLEKFFCNQEEK